MARASIPYSLMINLKDDGMHGGPVLCLEFDAMFHRIGASGELTVLDTDGCTTVFNPHRWLSYEIRKA
jgi:hypothetical protein